MKKKNQITSFTIKTLPCMQSLLGKEQTFKAGDKVAVYNTITKKVSYTLTIVNRGEQIDGEGNKYNNSLQSSICL